eukprot:GHVO01038957.1.p1 GENE.GHVO01038957.1~~GHVO01038957.1.p1  ORF type:complete len:161 (+),score=15.20 GHVO01038957.1:37-519(+)
MTLKIHQLIDLLQTAEDMGPHLTEMIESLQKQQCLQNNQCLFNEDKEDFLEEWERYLEFLKLEEIISMAKAALQGVINCGGDCTNMGFRESFARISLRVGPTQCREKLQGLQDCAKKLEEKCDRGIAEVQDFCDLVKIAAKLEEAFPLGLSYGRYRSSGS